MGDGGQYDDSELPSNIVGVLRKAPLHCQEGLAAEQNCVSHKPPVRVAEVAEFLLPETSRARTALYAGAIVPQAYLRMVGDIQEPLSVA